MLRSPLGDKGKDCPLLVKGQQAPAADLGNRAETALTDSVVIKTTTTDARRQIRSCHETGLTVDNTFIITRTAAKQDLPCITAWPR